MTHCHTYMPISCSTCSDCPLTIAANPPSGALNGELWYNSGTQTVANVLPGHLAFWNGTVWTDLSDVAPLTVTSPVVGTGTLTNPLGIDCAALIANCQLLTASSFVAGVGIQLVANPNGTITINNTGTSTAVPSATYVDEGIARLATTAEVSDGVIDTAVVTPKDLYESLALGGTGPKPLRTRIQQVAGAVITGLQGYLLYNMLSNATTVIRAKGVVSLYDDGIGLTTIAIIPQSSYSDYVVTAGVPKGSANNAWTYTAEVTQNSRTISTFQIATSYVSGTAAGNYNLVLDLNNVSVTIT